MYQSERGKMEINDDRLKAREGGNEKHRESELVFL